MTDKEMMAEWAKVDDPRKALEMILTTTTSLTR